MQILQVLSMITLIFVNFSSVCHASLYSLLSDKVEDYLFKDYICALSRHVSQCEDDVTHSGHQWLSLPAWPCPALHTLPPHSPGHTVSDNTQGTEATR